MADKPVSARQRIAENPFYVLGLGVAASRQEVEREGHKLLGMLELGLATAASYPSPLGPQPRTAELVRAAMAELRDPQRRLVAELWARLPATASAEASGTPDVASSGPSSGKSDDVLPALAAAPRLFGWAGRAWRPRRSP
jgi:hypothetical protein